MHHIADVKIENPVILVFDSKDRFNIILKLDVSNFIFLERCLALILPFVDIVVG